MVSSSVPEWSNFVVGAWAGMVATAVTNPLEVIKTRLQLQGELVKRGSNRSDRHYRGTIQALRTVVRHDGFRGLQKGLAPSLCFQFVANGLRFHTLSTVQELGWHLDEQGMVSWWRTCLWGGACGNIGGYAGSPFSMIKTQMQSHSASHIAVGYQRPHASMLNAFDRIYGKFGFTGLYRGALGNMPRAFIGSGVQVAAFTSVKNVLLKHNGNVDELINSLLAGMVAGSLTSISVQPLDILSTRVFNQPLDQSGRGRLYSGSVDCFVKIVRTEGVSALFKGFWPSYLRATPHSALVIFLFDRGKIWLDAYFLDRK